jgi:lipopolysaccharide export system permease protein
MQMISSVPRKAIQYIFFELLPSLVLGILVFILILLMAQALRYTEFVLIHGVGLEVVAQIMGYLSISFLPALLPMSLLFAILMTYGRLSQDSEIVAMKACGLSMYTITAPALLLGIVVALVSGQTSFYLAPWGNRQFELLVTDIGQRKTSVVIREGTFSEGFFDKVVYAKKVDADTNELTNVFIYDETQGEIPISIIAKRGHIIQDESKPNAILIRLFEGEIHRKSESHTKIKFETYDIQMNDPTQNEVREKSGPSLSIQEIQYILAHADLSEEQIRSLQSEFHKRWALSVVCVVFALVGVALGTNPHRRNQKSNSVVQSLIVVVVYWILYVTFEGFARNGHLPVGLSIWIPNAAFSVFAFWKLKKIWN